MNQTRACVSKWEAFFKFFLIYQISWSVNLIYDLPSSFTKRMCVCFFLCDQINKTTYIKNESANPNVWHSLNFTLALSVVLLRCVAGSLTVTHLSVMGEREVRLN